MLATAQFSQQLCGGVPTRAAAAAGGAAVTAK